MLEYPAAHSAETRQGARADVPPPGGPGGYYPELGEQPPERIFHAEFNHGTTYCLGWKVTDDEAARAHLRRLRIRPSEVKRYAPADWLPARRLGVEVFGGLATSAALAKLTAAGLVALRLLLD